MKQILLLISCLSAATGLSLPQKPVSSNRSDVDTLELVQIMWRHGDRTPIVQYPKDPLQDETLWYPYAEGFSALTLKGRMMHYNFGRFLRERYNGFLSDVYSPKEIFVQSSDADRAIMSALSNMAGMWPPSPNDPKSNWNPALPWQPVPIHTIPKSLDNFINFGADCPRFKELKHYYLQDSEFAKEINEDPENQKLFQYVSEHSGLNVTNFELISDLYDTLEIQKNYNMQLPEWTKSVLDTQMKKLAPLFFDQRVLVPDEETKRVKGGPLMKFLVKNMDVARNSSKLDDKEKASHRKAKMYVLSGHDTTSSIFLGSLGVFDTQFPSYASAAIVELHKGDKNQPASNEEDHFVRVFFRNETSVPPFEFEIPNCGYPCKLDKFKELFGNLMIDGDEWKTACKSGGQDPQKGYLSSSPSLLHSASSLLPVIVTAIIASATASLILNF